MLALSGWGDNFYLRFKIAFHRKPVLLISHLFLVHKIGKRTKYFG